MHWPVVGLTAPRPGRTPPATSSPRTDDDDDFGPDARSGSATATRPAGPLRHGHAHGAGAGPGPAGAVGAADHRLDAEVRTRPTHRRQTRYLPGSFAVRRRAHLRGLLVGA